MEGWDFPSDPEAKTPCSQHRGYRFDPWLIPGWVQWKKEKKGRINERPLTYIDKSQQTY